MIFWQEKLAVLAMPKTGTTALEKAAAPFADMVFSHPPAAKHMPVRVFNRFMRPYLAKIGLPDVQTMAVMREPVDWLGSWFRYRQRDFLADSVKSTRGKTFDEFVSVYLQDGERPAFVQVGQQSRFLGLQHDDGGVDHLFRYDDLDGACSFLQQRLGRKLTLPFANVSPKSEIALTPATEALLRSRHKIDFDCFDAIA